MSDNFKSDRQEKVFSRAPGQKHEDSHRASGIGQKFIALAIALATVGIPYASVNTPAGQRVAAAVAEGAHATVAAVDRVPSVAIGATYHTLNSIGKIAQNPGAVVDVLSDIKVASTAVATVFVIDLPDTHETKNTIDGFLSSLVDFFEGPSKFTIRTDNVLPATAHTAVSFYKNVAVFHTAAFDIFNDVSVTWYESVSHLLRFDTGDQSPLTDAERNEIARQLDRQNQ